MLTSKKTIFIIGIILLLGAVGYFVFLQQESIDAETELNQIQKILSEKLDGVGSQESVDKLKGILDQSLDEQKKQYEEEAKKALPGALKDSTLFLAQLHGAIPTQDETQKHIQKKAATLQQLIPAWLKIGGNPFEINPLIQKFEDKLKDQNFKEAETDLDEIIAIVTKPPTFNIIAFRHRIENKVSQLQALIPKWVMEAGGHPKEIEALHKEFQKELENWKFQEAEVVLDKLITLLTNPPKLNLITFRARIAQKIEEVRPLASQCKAGNADASGSKAHSEQFQHFIEKEEFEKAEEALDKFIAFVKKQCEVAAPAPTGEDISPSVNVKLGKIPASAEIVYHQNGLIYTMDHNGGNVTQLTFSTPRDYEHAAVSHNRRYIVANEHPKSDPGRSILRLYDLEEGTETQLIPDFYFAGDGGVDFAPNGYIYFKGKAVSSTLFSDIYKVKYDGTGLVRLTNTTNVEETDISVSADGTLVTYALFVPEPEKNSAHTEIWVINADGTNPRMVYRGGMVFKASVHDPEISPDNKKVIFSKVNSEVPPNFPNSPAANTAHDIWTVNFDGTGFVRLTKPGPISMIPDWQDGLVVYTEVSEKDKYAGASIVNDDGVDQSPQRIKAGVNSPKFIPEKIVPLPRSVEPTPAPTPTPAPSPTPLPSTKEIQYLIFQLFTYSPNQEGKTQPFDGATIRKQIDTLLTAVDNNRGDGATRQLGFAVGPLSFDHTNEELRTTIRESFKIAEEKNMAVVFHIDDSMFWIKRKDLWQNHNNVEWTDWNKTVHPNRIVGWVAGGTPILAPPMCYTSPAIEKEITRIAKDVIGSEIKKGVDSLKSKGKENLFAGVIAGWETRLDDDSNPRVQIGYCALSHLGYSKSNQPKNFDSELEAVIHDWIKLWAQSLTKAGISKDRIYTHIPVTNENIHTPLQAAFNEFSRPGFSVYLGTNSQKDTFTAISDELGNQGSPPWANAEGTNVSMRDFSSSGGSKLSSISWEEYLKKQFDRGATLVNIFAWPEPADGGSPFGRATHSPEAIEAYKNFLSGKLKMYGTIYLEKDLLHSVFSKFWHYRNSFKFHSKKIVL